ncbi:MAG: cytochrome C oxidase subunit IV family protein [Acidimicrobiales bacterium]|nr:cytochrome C oxidase subunit IV family protein [Acidimicrobiales bacterium]
MADAGTVEAPEAADAGSTHDDRGHDHPSDKDYVKVFLTLFVITAVEVAWLYLGLPNWALIGGLMVMMTVKFYLIAAQFMHLKVDIKLFTQLFLFGLVLAAAVYMAFLSSSDFWNSF